MYCKINKAQVKILRYYECRNMITVRFCATGVCKYAKVYGYKEVNLHASEIRGKVGRRITLRHLLRKLRCIVR